MTDKLNLAGSGNGSGGLCGGRSRGSSSSSSTAIGFSHVDVFINDFVLGLKHDIAFLVEFFVLVEGFGESGAGEDGGEDCDGGTHVLGIVFGCSCEGILMGQVSVVSGSQITECFFELPRVERERE